MQTVLQKLFISFFPLFLFAFSFESEINLFSDKLYFDVFNDKWKTLPSKEPLNRALDFSFMKIEIEDKNTALGYSYNSNAIIKINKGFIETWYYASNDFNVLLKKSDIGYYITEPKIYGVLNYSQFEKIYIKKNFINFNIYFNFLRGKQLQFMKINGKNTQNRFIADLSYYYTDKNIVTHLYEDDDYYGGEGFSFDIEGVVKKNNYVFNLGIYNLFGFINWRSITFMEYHFDSNTKYVGEDGYYHYKPFGIGRYKTDVNFFYRLPVFIKYSLERNLKKDYFLGVNGLFTEGVNFNEMYIGYKYFLVGYIPQTKYYIFGIKTRHFGLKISNDIKFHSKTIVCSLKINF
jgi:hypothetical protein